MTATQIRPQQSTVRDIVERIFESHRITRADQRSLLSKSTITDEEERLINQVFDELKRGVLRVTD